MSLEEYMKRFSQTPSVDDEVRADLSSHFQNRLTIKREGDMNSTTATPTLPPHLNTSESKSLSPEIKNLQKRAKQFQAIKDNPEQWAKVPDKLKLQMNRLIRKYAVK